MGIVSSNELSPQQWRIVVLLAQGLTNEQIGKKLRISRYTVANYLRIIYDNTGMWTRLELALWYVKLPNHQVMSKPLGNQRESSLALEPQHHVNA